MTRCPRLLSLSVLLAVTALLAGLGPFAAPAKATYSGPPACDENLPFCAEVVDPIGYDQRYTGHDEPSLLFYSNTSGSGNNNLYNLTLPTDPPTLPKQDGTGGTFNFQLHPAFWFGMALCDDQSAPNPGGSWAGPTIGCTADSDSNIYEDASTTSGHYI